LGSGTLLTDANGIAYQFFVNLPFGETLAEQRATGVLYNNVYKFTGKELDAETGLYYLGARYYSPVDGIFLNVDPLAGSFPSWGPYVYTLNNPVRLTDPTGMAPEGGEDWIDNGDGTYTAQAGDSAASLARDAGISDERANMLVENQLGANYIGKDGELKSNVNIGDVVDINNTGNNSVYDWIGGFATLGDGSFTFLGGLGLNFQEVGSYGNSGTRFRARLFRSNYLMLKGSWGENIASTIKYGGPLLTAGSIGLSLFSDQSVGWKVGDTAFSLAGLYGGPIGATASVGYTFSLKPLLRAVINPTPEELQSMHAHQVRYCNRQICY
jgi:RHS repeat-associated protein